MSLEEMGAKQDALKMASNTQELVTTQQKRVDSHYH